MVVWGASAAPAGAQGMSDETRIAVAERLQESSVAVRVGQGSGSGFVASAEGWVITNAHVVQGYRRNRVQIRYGDGTVRQARVIAYDPSHDLAVLEPSGRPSTRPLALGDPEAVRVGQTVLAFGSPFGLEGTLTQGIVSARRDLPGIAGNDVHQLIQTDAPINPGNSGGPLTNARGEVIGVNTAILSRTGGSHGIGFAVPVNYVQGLLTRLRAERSGQPLAEVRPNPRDRQPRQRPQPRADLQPRATPRARPQPNTPPRGRQAVPRPSGPVWLGIFGDDFRAAGYTGVRVQSVIPGGPAAAAGILGATDPPPPFVHQLGIQWTGHIILAVDGHAVATMEELSAALRRRRPGDQATIFVTVGPGVVSGEAVLQLVAPPAEAPSTPAGPQRRRRP